MSNSSMDAKPFPGLPCSAAKVSRTTGDDEPAHFILKIESFSVLSKSGIKQYESQDFQASGFKWKLLLYPQGNEEQDGQNHISLYLLLADTTSLPSGWNVHVYFTFFVYDHVRKNYLTIQVADRKKTQFHAMKTKSGFGKLISLDCFKDSLNGYLYNDSCVFGVEVFVTPSCTAMESCLSMTQPASRINTYTWIVEKFSTIKCNDLYSDEFKVGKLKWKLRLFPKGHVSVRDKLSIFLGVSDISSFPLGGKFYVKYKLRVKDQIGDNKHIEKEGSAWFSDSSKNWGFSSFMLESQVKDPFLVNDNIIIEAEILALGTIRNYT